MITRELLEKEKQKYEELVNHPLQSWHWGSFREKTGIEVVRLGVFDGQNLVSAYQLTIHKIPKTNFSIGYFPKGPKPTKEMIAALKKLGKEKNLIFIKLEPNLIINDKNSFNNQSLGLVEGKPFFTKYTFHLNLQASDEELLAKMKSKTRYNLKLSKKHNVKVTEDNSDKAFEEYLGLMWGTTKRQGFFAHSKDYHRKMWQILSSKKIAHLLTAKQSARGGAKTLAAWVLFKFKNILYYPYGGSTRDQKNIMASYAMMWEAIQFGKREDCKTFDLWGTLGPTPDKNDPWYGFHHFKEGFGPEMVEFAGTYDLVINPSLYSLYKIADSVRWKFLKLKTKLPI
ncbi:MAG: peptidoglycan bridge formation glycyltransferase FemA/FemB family protein [Patescibacteria group bacterium]